MVLLGIGKLIEARAQTIVAPCSRRNCGADYLVSCSDPAVGSRQDIPKSEQHHESHSDDPKHQLRISALYT